ncbi:hypothetical protein [Ferroacidibacillus organovorans]|uniref:hypothetical protein n=1 Tax=Ferroacidibacillus organovorans TaxID=1765683 RepID=UPI00136618C4|nr:hypothetical protein [Ferroacidibacillus organovorans]
MRRNGRKRQDWAGRNEMCAPVDAVEVGEGLGGCLPVLIRTAKINEKTARRLA